MVGDIATRWKELSGSSKWKDLLDPLDLDLRRYILHYGDMAEEIAATPKKSSLLEPVTSKPTLSDEGKKLLGRRGIVVAWRGTIQLYEWANDFDFPLESAVMVFPGANPNDEPRVANGWLSLYTSTDPRSRFDKTSAQEQVQEELKRLLELYKNEDVTITLTGHSLGAVMSILSAADFLHNEWPKITPSLQHSLCVTVFAFGSPQIGDRSFKRLVESLEHLHILRVTNVPDLIPRYPVFRFTDIGEELQINTLKSEYLKRSLNLGHFHNLEAYLHGVAGTQHNQGEFKLEINRDIALVNKGLDALEDKYLVPGHWWVLENKGMVQSDDGTWKLNGDRSKKKQEEEDEKEENNCKFP
nr:putative lipase [Arabidopsis thaliana]